MPSRSQSVSISEIIQADSFTWAVPRRDRDRTLPQPFPIIRPGQLWLVELPADGGPVRHGVAGYVLDQANVVIYDRALTETVAVSLPLGGYAEPAAAQRETAASRSVQFTRDGWSVARLLPSRLPQRERTRRVQDIVDELAAAQVAGRLPVTILAKAVDGIEERFEARFDDLAAIVASYPRDTKLAIVIEAFPGGVPARLHTVAANGLAG
jgi:hypothetical protein